MQLAWTLDNERAIIVAIPSDSHSEIIRPLFLPLICLGLTTFTRSVRLAVVINSAEGPSLCSLFSPLAIATVRDAVAEARLQDAAQNELLSFS